MWQNARHTPCTIRLGESLNKKWKIKVMHGEYVRSIDSQVISEDVFSLLIYIPVNTTI